MAMYFKSKEWRKSLTCQKKKILQNWDNWKVVLDRKRRVLIATGLLSPDVSTKDFKVQIRLSYQGHPVVRLLQHDFHRDSEGNLPPHLYRDLSLCLYYPVFKEWSHNMYLSDTIMLWTLRWLFHYEVWKETEEWIGGGTIHNRKFKVSKIEEPKMI